MSAFQAEDGGFKSPRGGHFFRKKTGKTWPFPSMVGDINGQVLPLFLKILPLSVL